MKNDYSHHKDELKKQILANANKDFISFSMVWRWTFDCSGPDDDVDANKKLLQTCFDELVQEGKVNKVKPIKQLSLSVASNKVTDSELALNISPREYYCTPECFRNWYKSFSDPFKT